MNLMQRPRHSPLKATWSYIRTTEEARGATAASYASVAAEAKANELDGRYVEALDAWGRLAQDPDALTPAQRIEWEEATDRLTVLTRGRVEDDPASTQREVLDFQRSGAERSAQTRAPTSAVGAVQRLRSSTASNFWLPNGVV